MSPPSDEEALHDAFDRFLDAHFHGRPIDPSNLTPEHDDLRAGVVDAANLAEWVVSPPHAVLPAVLSRYRIVKEIGHGGMGTVFLAHDEQLRRDVALKVLSQSDSLSERNRRRFVHETRAMARLEHENVVRIHDVIDDDGVLAYAMELVDGLSLREVLQALLHRRPADADDIDALARVLGEEAGGIADASLAQFWLRIGIAIARALQRVHEAGIVHRDVKPGNILLRRDGHPLLADFGLAREADSSMSNTGAFVGTPAYAPPEQLVADVTVVDAAEPVDHRADVYALGATLYECFAGAPPFAGTSPAALLHRITTLGARPLRKVAPRAPRDLEAVLEQAMNPDRERRYATAAEFADDLERVLLLRPVRARRVGVVVRGVRALRHRHPAFVGGAVVAVLALAIAGFWLDTAHRRERTTEAVAAQLRHARAILVEPEVRSATWHALQLGRVGAVAFDIGQRRRRAAVGHYDRALALRPDPVVALERDALRLVVDLPDLVSGRLDGELLVRDYPALLIGDEEPDDGLDILLERIAKPPDPRTASYMVFRGSDPQLEWLFGLLAYLAGDERRCEDFWHKLGEAGAQWPLLDVALGGVFLDDGRFSLALPRRQRAVLAFPDSWHLRLDLATIFLELEDFGSARHVLRAVEPEAEQSLRYRLLRAWAEADADIEVALRKIRAIVAEAPTNEAARFRLACLEHRLGNDQAAIEIMRQLVEAAPGTPCYRLWLARLAVRAGDLDLYLIQARWVVANGFGLLMSRGETRDLLDILQVGGLTGLYTRGVERTQHRGRPDIGGLPPTSWARPPYGSLQQLEEALLAGR